MTENPDLSQLLDQFRAIFLKREKLRVLYNLILAITLFFFLSR